MTLNIANAAQYDAWTTNSNFPDLPTGSSGQRMFQMHYAPPLVVPGDPAIRRAYERLTNQPVVVYSLTVAERAAGLPALLARFYPDSAADMLSNSSDLDAARYAFSTGQIVLPVHPRVDIMASAPAEPTPLPKLPAAPSQAPRQVTTRLVVLPSAEALRAASDRLLLSEHTRYARAGSTTDAAELWPDARRPDETEQQFAQRASLSRAARNDAHDDRLRTAEDLRLGQLEHGRPIFAEYTAVRNTLGARRAAALRALDFAGAERIVAQVEALDAAADRALNAPSNPERPLWSSGMNQLRGEVYRALVATGLSEPQARARVRAAPLSGSDDPLAGLNDVNIF